MITTQTWQPCQAAPTAFPERKALMPIWGGEAVTPELWQQVWLNARSRALNEDALAYIHIPFCASHCVFCGFYRNAWKDDYSKIYTDKLIEELAFDRSLSQGKGKIKAVYFGGGTPTALHKEDLVRLIQACYHYLPLADDCEFTLEGRISHFDLEKAAACVEAGVNRISIGVQTFNSALRKRLGRKHSGEQAYHYLEALCQLNAVIIADFIFGLPNQNDEIWAKDIELASQLPIAGLDIYAFNNYPFLPINRLIQHGTLPQPASAEIQSQHYAYAVEKLIQANWQQVSNNHFAYPGRGERNWYNTLVKSNMDCLAFGAGAGGNFGGYSFQVQASLPEYLATEPQQKAISYLSKHGVNKSLLSEVQHNMELGMIDTSLFQGNLQAMQLLDEWQSLSLLKITSDGVAKLNTSGRYWSPTLVRQLMLTFSDHTHH
ncbi:oxygen-independent coproporphyrinogen-3 oxidase [Bibersteinia trehalosi]|nr:oxygen-independent coproporphyrinogen-3 oxidase [Bibersteinia trehalosi]